MPIGFEHLRRQLCGGAKEKQQQSSIHSSISILPNSLPCKIINEKSTKSFRNHENITSNHHFSNNSIDSRKMYEIAENKAYLNLSSESFLLQPFNSTRGSNGTVSNVAEQTMLYRSLCATQFAMVFPTLSRHLIHKWISSSNLLLSNTNIIPSSSSLVNDHALCSWCGSILIPGISARKKICKKRKRGGRRYNLHSKNELHNEKIQLHNKPLSVKTKCLICQSVYFNSLDFVYTTRKNNALLNKSQGNKSFAKNIIMASNPLTFQETLNPSIAIKTCSKTVQTHNTVSQKSIDLNILQKKNKKKKEKLDKSCKPSSVSSSDKNKNGDIEDLLNEFFS